MSEMTTDQNPTFTEDEVRTVVADAWGLHGTFRELGSLQDQNFLLRTADGRRGVVKIAGRHTAAAAIDLQNAALLHLAQADAGFDTPQPLPTRGGASSVVTAGHVVRLLSWVDGVPLSERPYVGPDDLADLGALAARVSVALDGFDHPALQVQNEWDIRRSDVALRELVGQLPDEWLPRIEHAIGTFERVRSSGATPPLAVVHGDVTPVNVVCAPGETLASRPTGVIDFGDVMRSWRVGDAAAIAVGALEHPGTGDSLVAALSVLAGYHAVAPFTEPELDMFWPLVVVRAAITAAISGRQLAKNPASAYAAEAVTSGLRSVARAAAVPHALAQAAVRQRCGLPTVPGVDAAMAWLRAQPVAELVPGISSAEVVDLSVDADTYSAGEWADAAWLRERLTAAHVTITRWGEARPAAAPGAGAPHTLQLGAEVVVAPGTPVAAPIAGTVRMRPDGVLLELLAPLHLRLSGVTTDGVVDGATVNAGQQIATVAAGSLPHVHVQLLTGADLPRSGRAAHRQAWAALCPDPSPLLGSDVAAPPPVTVEQLRRTRDEAVAKPQHLYYAQPPAIVRGYRHHLYDADGRCYVDMINNIAAVGHAHPRVTAAATRQLGRLNTNSRFLYDAMGRYSQRIAELLPPELDAVFLVNSGSEAADLALQLAQRYTGRRDVVALAGAYHGWTGSVLAVCTSPMDRPQWRDELEDWVHVAEQPDTYRGDPSTFRASVRKACEDASTHGGVAAFVCEPLLGNQGGLELPPGYLAGVYDDVRAAGGLCVADEVQVGMGRTGATFWAFEHEGVVPDIVYSAKATGNGHPLGVVACRREIADRFDGQTAYFSSTGGGPVSCEIGIAVLDIIRDEGLQANALEIGTHLRAGLTELAGRHELIGAVHGRGLYQGIDLVTDRDVRTPAIYAAMAISERLRAVGVIMQPTGDAFNVLKVKPPMCLDRAAADYFLEALDGVLTELV